MFSYRVVTTDDDNGTVLITFPDVPEAITFADSEDNVLANAEEALSLALAGYIADRRPLPPPSPKGNGMFLSLGLVGSMKLAVYQAMVERGWRKADLARALDQNPRQIDRLLNLRHASTVPQIESALQALGRKAEFAVI